MNNNDLAAVIAVISAPELFGIGTGNVRTASKAEEKSRPPGWYYHAEALTKLLTGAWHLISREWSARLLKTLEDGDLIQASKLLKQTDALGKELVNEVGPTIEKICSDLQKHSHKYWLNYRNEFFGVATKAEKLDLPKVGSKEALKDYPSGYQEYLAKAHADQIKMFVEVHPTRNIHPQIERQLEWIKQSDLTRATDVLQLKERLERINNTLGSERYWEGLSHSHVSRLWHHDGILLAEKNGVTVGQVSGPYDKRTCPVCQRVIGMEVSIPQAADHVRASAKIKDPDEYVKANPYPRLKDVDNKGRNELKKLGARLLPPYHGRCRHEVIWLYAMTAKEKRKKDIKRTVRRLAAHQVVSEAARRGLVKLIDLELERIKRKRAVVEAIAKRPAKVIEKIPPRKDIEVPSTFLTDDEWKIARAYNRIRPIKDNDWERVSKVLADEGYKTKKGAPYATRTIKSRWNKIRDKATDHVADLADLTLDERKLLEIYEDIKPSNDDDWGKIAEKLAEHGIKTKKGTPYAARTIKTRWNKIREKAAEEIAALAGPAGPVEPEKVIPTTKPRTRPIQQETRISAAQPKTTDLRKRITKTKDVPILEENAKQIAEGFYKQQDYVQMDYLAPFKSKAKAEAWVLKNLANRVDFGEASIERINATLAPLRVINQNMPLKSARLKVFQITKIKESSGLFWSNTRTLQIADNVPCWFGTLNQKKTKLLERQQPFLDNISRMLDRHNKAKPKEITALKKWQRERRILNKLKTEREKIIDRIKTDTKHRGNFKNTVSSQYDSNAGGTAVHEYAHAWHYEYDDEITKRFGLSWQRSTANRATQIQLEKDLCKKFKVSEYSASDWAECMAENFTCYMQGEVRRMHPEMVRFLDQQLGKRLRFGMKLDSYRCYDDAPIKYSKDDPMPTLKPAAKPKKTRGPP